MRIARLPQHQRALDGAKHVALLSPRLVAKVAPVRREAGSACAGPGECMATQHCQTC